MKKCVKCGTNHNDCDHFCSQCGENLGKKKYKYKITCFHNFADDSEAVKLIKGMFKQYRGLSLDRIEPEHEPIAITNDNMHIFEEK